MIAIDEDYFSGDAGAMTYEVEANGIKYRLEGDSAKLKELFGHEVEVAGTVAESVASNASSESKDAPKTFQVLDLKDLSSNCKASK